MNNFRRTIFFQDKMNSRHMVLKEEIDRMYPNRSKSGLFLLIRHLFCWMPVQLLLLITLTATMYCIEPFFKIQIFGIGMMKEVD